MSGPLQAWPSCICRYLPQAARPHGSSLPCVAPRVASHEAVPLVDERAEVTPHYTSHSPYQGVAQLRMGAIHRRHMITTDASMTGWGAFFEGRPASGEWTGEFLSWHINCLQLRAVFLALMYFLPVHGEHHIIVRTDNMAVVSHINRQGGSRSRTLDRYPWRIFVWWQDGPLCTPLSGFTTLTLIRLQVLRSCLFELAVCCWFVIGPGRQRF